jgi:hypothetical protein
VDEVEVGRFDGLTGNEPFTKKIEKRLPVVATHQDEREVINLACLDERSGLEDFIHCAISAREDDEAVGVFDEHDFAHEKVAEVDEFIEVWIWLLLHGEFDIAADGSSADVLCAAVGGFHDARSASGHDGEADFGKLSAHLTGKFVMRAGFVEARGAEDGHARPDEVQPAEAANELGHDADGAEELIAARARPFEEAAFVRVGGGLAPRRVGAGIGHAVILTQAWTHAQRRMSVVRNLIVVCFPHADSVSPCPPLPPRGDRACFVGVHGLHGAFREDSFEKSVALISVH